MYQRQVVHHEEPTALNSSSPFIFTVTSGTLLFTLFSFQQIECSPTFNGVPIATSFLCQQAYPIFNSEFPGLELSPVFVSEHKDFSYEEGGWLSPLFPSWAEARLPVYPVLPPEEEAKLGMAGLKKRPVGYVYIKGDCKYGCAMVSLSSIRLEKINGDVVWEWHRESK